jgi:hypothetical protein
MPNAKIIVTSYGQELRHIELAGGITTLGRTPDNIISFSGDSNVSRYHAEIERRGNDFYIVDLGSSNGSTVNGEPLRSERKLQDGDVIILGGSSEMAFHAQKTEQPEAKTAPATADSSAAIPPLPTSAEAPGAATAQPAESASKLPLILAVAAVMGGLAVVSVVAMILFLPTVGSTGSDIITGNCSGSASILTPEDGITISEETDVKLDVKNENCIERVVFHLDGEEIASVESPPYAISLDPENMGKFADENSHILTIGLQNRNGDLEIQSEELTLAFSDDSATGKNKKGNDEDPPGANDPPKKDFPQEDRQASLGDIKQMSERLVKQFSGNAAYKFDSQFLQQVQKKTTEFKSEGYFNRAAAYRDSINVAFVGEQGLDAPLGYILAMSRSKFDVKKSGSSATTGKEEGLWQMTNDFVAANGYNGQCGTETLSDPTQTCAARAAAIYTKAIVVNLFQGDVLYGAACFGMSPQEAGQFQLTLPPDRSDFWNAIKSPKQRENLVNFFAAGIVAENPNKFGMKRDKPLSNLYKNLIAKQP